MKKKLNRIHAPGKSRYENAAPYDSKLSEKRELIRDRMKTARVNTWLPEEGRSEIKGVP